MEATIPPLTLRVDESTLRSGLKRGEVPALWRAPEGLMVSARDVVRALILARKYAPVAIRGYKTGRKVVQRLRARRGSRLRKDGSGRRKGSGR